MEAYSKSRGYGLAYEWRDNNNAQAGVYSDRLTTPTVNSNPLPLKHADFCVIPENPNSGPCRRRLEALPDQQHHRQLHQPQEEGTTPLPNKQRVQASVLMARTPTAAGMKHVLPNTKVVNKNSVPMDTYESSQDKAWDILKQDFGVDKTAFTQLRSRLEEDMEGILVDAFHGQCTPGHSCKESTKKALGLLLDNKRTEASA